MLQLPQIKYIETVPAFNEMVDALADRLYIGIDTEGSNLDPYMNNLMLISIYDEVDTIAYVINVRIIEDISALKPLLENKTCRKIGQNLTYDWKVFHHTNRIVMEYMHDIMIVEKMLFAGLKYKNGLKDIVARRLQIEMSKDTRDTFINNTVSTFTEEQIRYAAMDAYYPVVIYHQQLQEIQKKKLERIYDLEMNILPPTALMEYTGIYVDRAGLESMIEPFEKFVSSAEKALQDLFIFNGAANEIVVSKDGYKAINTNAHQQIIAAMNTVGVKIDTLDAKKLQRWDMMNSKKKKGAGWDIDYSEMTDDDEVAQAMELFTGLDNKYLRAYAFLQAARKLVNNYIHGFIASIHPITQRVHPVFSSYGAESTGRYSSRKPVYVDKGPQFQNIPNDKKLERLQLGKYSIRKCIKATKGRKLIIADYSGIELVILAAASGDERLLQEILAGDVHTMVAQDVLGCKGITKENKKEMPYKLWRDASKQLSYSVAYGTTGRNASETLNINLARLNITKYTPKDGDDIIDRWYKLFPKTAEYLQSNARQAITKGYVTDVWGRRRQWDLEIIAKDKWKKLAAGREGQNFPIQATSATMTKRAIALLWNKLDRKRARVIITVHDEIVVESVVSYAEKAAQIMKECMEQSIKETLPILADKIGMYEGTSVNPAISDCYDK